MNGVLAGYEEAGGIDFRECGAFVGTSAGSIVATALAGGVSPAARLGRLPEQPAVTAAGEPGLPQRALSAAAWLAGAVAAPAASLALRSSAAGGALLRRTALARVPIGRRSLAGLGGMVDDLGVGWDGRLRVAAVELESGRRVMFGAPGSPDVRVADAVLASCAIPGVFRPLRAGGRSYVDGGAWSPTNMDAAAAGRGDRVLCLNPTGSLRAQVGDLAGALGVVSRGIAGAEALALRRRGARVTTVSPDRASAEAMGTNLMDPGPRAAVTAAAVAQGRRLAA